MDRLVQNQFLLWQVPLESAPCCICKQICFLYISKVWARVPLSELYQLKLKISLGMQEMNQITQEYFCVHSLVKQLTLLVSVFCQCTFSQFFFVSTKCYCIVLFCFRRCHISQCIQLENWKFRMYYE